MIIFFYGVILISGIDKINEYYNNYGVNVNRGVYELSYKATDEYEQTRVLTAKFINSNVKEVVFTKGASNGLNLVALSYGMKNVNEGDEIIVTTRDGKYSSRA